MKKRSLLLYGILLLALILRLINLNQSLWLDEAAQAIESSGSLSSLRSITADFMPPLYHVLLHFWMMLSTTEVWMRLLSVFFGVGTVYATYRITKELFSERIAHLSALLLAINPFHMYYSQELRPYALAVFISVVATFFLLRNKFIMYTIFSILTVYSFYPAAFLLLAHGVYTILRESKKLSRWLFSMLIVLFSFLPWLPTFWLQLSGGSGLIRLLPGWSDAVSVAPMKAIPLTLVKFLLGRVTIDNKFVYGIVFIVLLFVVLWLWFQSFKKWKESNKILTILVGIPTIAAFLISFVLPIIAPQRLLFSLPFFLIILASGIDSVRKQIKPFLFTAILIPNVFGLVQYYLNPRFQREQWRQATTFVEKQADTHTVVVFAFPEPFAPFLWYRKNNSLGLGVAKNFIVDEKDGVYLGNYIRDKNNVYFFRYLTDLTDPEKKILTRLDQDGFSKTHTTDFPGVGFVEEYNRR